MRLGDTQRMRHTAQVPSPGALSSDVAGRSHSSATPSRVNVATILCSYIATPSVTVGIRFETYFIVLLPR
jgi:hypothetical protein